MLCWGSNKAKYQGLSSIICVSVKIDNMLQVDRSGVQQCSLLGPCEGLSFSFWDITNGQEPHMSGPACGKRSREGICAEPFWCINFAMHTHSE
jgi:hypothetical protein